MTDIFTRQRLFASTHTKAADLFIHLLAAAIGATSATLMERVYWLQQCVAGYVRSAITRRIGRMIS